MYGKAEGRTRKRKGGRRDGLSSNHHVEKKGKGLRREGQIPDWRKGRNGRMKGRRKVPREYRKRKG